MLNKICEKREVPFHSRRFNIWTVRVPEKGTRESWREEIIKQIMGEHLPEHLPTAVLLALPFFGQIWHQIFFPQKKKKKVIAILVFPSTQSSLEEKELIFCQSANHPSSAASASFYLVQHRLTKPPLIQSQWSREWQVVSGFHLD